MSFIFTMNRFVLFFCYIFLSWDFLIHVTYKITRFSATFSVFYEMKNKDWVFFISYFVTLLLNFTWNLTQILENNWFFGLKQNIKSLQKCDISFHLFVKKKQQNRIEAKILKKSWGCDRINNCLSEKCTTSCLWFEKWKLNMMSVLLFYIRRNFSQSKTNWWKLISVTI